MRVRLRVLTPGTRVRLRRPGRGERGLWVVGRAPAFLRSVRFIRG